MTDDVKIILKNFKLQLLKRCVYNLRMEGWLETRRNWLTGEKFDS